MASTTQKITFVYSRQKNGLCEVQRWWPAYIKNDGVGGLTVDPVLFRSTFGPDTIADEGRGLMDEANTAGLRVEMIGFDGSAPSGTPSLEIIGSGTLDARCVLTHEDGTKTEWRFIGPSADGILATGSAGYGASDRHRAMSMNDGMNPATLASSGPYPVFATMQDFADWLDGYVNHGFGAYVAGFDENAASYSFLPAGLIEPDTSAWPPANADPRQDAANKAAIPTSSKMCATIFMPLLLDNNQMRDSQSGNTATSDIVKGQWDGATIETGAGNSGAYFNFYDEGMTRYDQSPNREGGAVIYKQLGNSGDHKPAKVGSYHTTDPTYNPDNIDDFINNDSDPSSSAYGGPSYRMRTALACFLKDGTYLLTGGSFIPYIYDPARTIGGSNGNTCYAVWNGDKGIANTPAEILAVDTDEMSSAQIFPLTEFVQGPLCSGAQGWNWDADVDGLTTYMNWIYYTQEQTDLKAQYDTTTYSGQTRPNSCTKIGQPRQGLVRPNPIRAKIYAAEQIGTTNATGLAGITTGECKGVLKVWIEKMGTKSVHVPSGMPVNLDFLGLMDGTKDIVGNNDVQYMIGTNTPKVGATENYQLGDTGTAATTGTLLGVSRSGWWIPSISTTLTAVNKSTIVAGATGTFTGVLLEFYINQEVDLPDIASYEEGGWACQGLMGGAEVQYGTGTYTTGSWPYQPLNDPTNGTLGGTGQKYSPNAKNKYNIPAAQFDGKNALPFYSFPTGLGWNAGWNQAGQNVPTAAGHDYRHPTVAVNSPQATWVSDFSGYQDDQQITPRGLSIVAADDSRYLMTPTAQGIGGGMLRLPAPPNFGLADYYYSPTEVLHLDDGTNAPIYGDFSGYFAYGPLDVAAADSSIFKSDTTDARWRSKSMVMPLYSYMENRTGDSGFDKTLPSSWRVGRNRPYPIHERIGTKGGYGPLSGLNYWAINNANAAHSSNRPQVGEETIMTGLAEIGCSPIWLDLTIRAWWPTQTDRMTLIEFDTGAPSMYHGRHAFTTRGTAMAESMRSGFLPRSQGGSSSNRPEWTSWESMIINSQVSQHIGNTELFIWGGSKTFDSTGFDAAAWKNTLTNPANGWIFNSAMGSNNVGWGNMSNGYGTGTPTTISEGYHTIRTTFDEEGMLLNIDGTTIGKDLNVNNPVWGFAIQMSNAGGAGARASTSPIIDPNNYYLFPSGMAYNKSQADLQIDEMVVRQIPSLPMTPFPVDTITQQVAGVGKYTALSIEADNISVNAGMNVRVSICPVSANVGGREIEGGTPYTGFSNMDCGFVGGYGSVDLSTLPADAITNGFVIRFLFFTPTASDPSLQPVNWSSTPIVRAWTLEYDLSPTSTIACTGNTFNGDTVAPIDTKVGHIVSFRGTATTTDIDRTMSSVRFNFGDGVSTDWLPFTDQTLQSNTFDTAHSYLTTGTYSATLEVRDDVGNLATSAALSVVVANAPPVAILRAVPSLVRAGDVCTLDATDSFDVNAGGSLTSYTFDFGDGSGTITQGTPTAQHTYAAAGEYRATLTVLDADSAVSQTASSIVKCLPATLIVPLVFNTKPRAFNRTRSAEIGMTPVLDAVYPEMTDTGNRSDTFSLSGMFLKSTANSDIGFVEELLLTGALVEFLYENVDYVGNPSGKVFTGRITSFDYERQGGEHGQTPYTITLVREAGLGV